MLRCQSGSIKFCNQYRNYTTQSVVMMSLYQSSVSESVRVEWSVLIIKQDDNIKSAAQAVFIMESFENVP